VTEMQKGLMMLRDIRYFELVRGQRGWLCEIEGRIPTRGQFSHETHRTRGYGRHGWRGPLGVASAVVAGVLEWRAARRELAAMPGEFASDE
jgi:hypothetical protein